jgi:hypothetical protein
MNQSLVMVSVLFFPVHVLILMVNTMASKFGFVNRGERGVIRVECGRKRKIIRIREGCYSG